MSVASILDAAPTRPPTAAQPAGHGLPERPGPAARLRARLLARGPLALVLTVQGALSLRLVWANTAFQDEGLYLRAGHLEWAHWLHGAPVPAFASYFSGAPVLYPPLGALADSAGGLAAARLLSLAFMLTTSSLLWATARRLYGRRAALLATALFATLAGTQFLGALATYDALALCLLALATWLCVRSADCQAPARSALLVAAGVVLAAADAVKYATVLFTPVVVAVAALTVLRAGRARAALPSAGTVLASWLLAVAVALWAAGPQYWRGIEISTIARPPAATAWSVVAQRAYVWMSLLLVLAVLGALLALRGRARGRYLPAVLAAAAVLAPIVQIRLHTTVSLQKHVVFGAWFAAIAAGYCLARLSRVDPGRGWAPVMAVPIAAATLFGSLGQASALTRTWPNAAEVVALLRAAVPSHRGQYLAEDYDVEAYYLRDQVSWRRWSSTYYFSYPGSLPGAPAYAAAIDAHYFSIVILCFGDTAATDNEIVADMRRAGGYEVLARAGQYTVWVLRKRSAAGTAHASR
jgi:4-amino-4-deoxy-L-arabinose transferase-like glycosyltransferase